MIRHNIANVLAGLRGVSFLGLDHETVVPLKGGKKNEMQGRVTKRVRGSTVLVAQNKNTNTYENMVRNRIVGELVARAQARAVAGEEALGLLVDVLSSKELARLEVQIEAALNKEDHRATAEERFTVSARKWGERIPNTPIIQHVRKGASVPTYYLDMIFLTPGREEFFLDGQPIAERDILGYERPVAREGANVQGGLAADQQIQVRSIGLQNIQSIRTGGAEYRGEFYYGL